LAAAERGLAIQPGNTVCLNVRSVALINLGRRDEAGANFDSSLAIDPLNPAAHLSKGMSLLQNGDRLAAMEHFQESLRLNPNSPWAQAGRRAAMRRRGIVLKMVSRYLSFLSSLSSFWQWALVYGLVAGGYAVFFVMRLVFAGSDIMFQIELAAAYPYVLLVAFTFMGSPTYARLLRWAAARGYNLTGVSVASVFAGCGVAAVLMLIPFWNDLRMWLGQ